MCGRANFKPLPYFQPAQPWFLYVPPTFIQTPRFTEPVYTGPTFTVTTGMTWPNLPALTITTAAKT